MLTYHQIRRSAVACGLACALLASVTTGSAVAAGDGGGGGEGGGEAVLVAPKPAPKQDLRGPDGRDAANAREIALAQERYYSSYGEPEPLAPVVPASPAPADETPWLPIALSIAAALGVVSIAAAHRHRLRIRRRAVGATS